MENNEYSRRKFVTKCLSSVGIFFGAAAVINSCQSNKSEKAEKNQSKSGDPCDDLSNVSSEEIEKRNKLGYVTKSSDPDRSCDNCSLHIPPTDGKGCGGCLLFKGPVKAEGYCIQYAAKV
jgi:hypothetical protein